MYIYKCVTIMNIICYYQDLIDKVLKEDDLDNDGYLGYVEYVLGRQRDHIVQAKRDTNLRIGK